MPSHVIYQYGLAAIWTLFLFAIGACVGSLTNVLVYRLPLGLSVVTPPSRCPVCDTRLTWRENIPIFGWVFLRGKCRFCRSRISPEYPLVELFVAVLFVVFFVLWYLVPTNAVWLGVNWGSIRPEWARGDVFFGWPRESWPAFLVLLTLLSCLTAMTLVDAKTFTIPLQLPWVATVAGIVIHTLAAAWVQHSPRGSLFSVAPGWIWSIATPGGSGGGANSASIAWWWVGAALGAVVGLALSMILLNRGLIRRSFADYNEWEEQALKRNQAAGEQLPRSDESTGPLQATDAPVAPTPTAHRHRWMPVALTFIGSGILLALAGSFLGPSVGLPQWSGLAAAVVLAPVFAGIVMRRQAGNAALSQAVAGDHSNSGSIGSPAEMWIQYPHARREMVKELLFLTPCVGLAWLGGAMALRVASQGTMPPLWLLVLTGTLMGYLIGGGIVWGVRILGTLAFGKEAMGLGDVHLMAAVGACAGWIDAAIAFPLAAFVGLYWTVISRVWSGSVARAMPFGPYLAVATLIVLVAKPLIEQALTALLRGGGAFGNINIP